MIKLIVNQLVHRFKTSKILILIYFLFFCAICMKKQMLHIPYYATSLLDESIISFIIEINMYSDYFLFLIWIGIVFVIKLYKDYKKGATRWFLLTNKVEGRMIGDTIFICFCFIILYSMAFIGDYFIIQDKLEQLQKLKLIGGITMDTVLQTINRIKLLHELYPMHVVGTLANVFGLLYVSQIIVYISNFLVKEKIRFLYLLWTLFAIITLFGILVMEHAFMQILLYSVMIVVYFIATRACTKHKKGVEQYVKN